MACFNLFIAYITNNFSSLKKSFNELNTLQTKPGSEEADLRRELLESFGQVIEAKSKNRITSLPQAGKYAQISFDVCLSSGSLDRTVNWNEAAH